MKVESFRNIIIQYIVAYQYIIVRLERTLDCIEQNYSTYIFIFKYLY